MSVEGNVYFQTEKLGGLRMLTRRLLTDFNSQSLYLLFLFMFLYVFHNLTRSRILTMENSLQCRNWNVEVDLSVNTNSLL